MWESFTDNLTMAHTCVRWETEMTDTFGGEPNYSWIRRGSTLVPENASRRTIVRMVKADLGLTGVRCRTFDDGDRIELRPYGECTVAFAFVRF